eukprot:Skav208599  [mRNA]  locus=scaffold598:186330:190917:+ [translate_table: standard]
MAHHVSGLLQELDPVGILNGAVMKSRPTMMVRLHSCILREDHVILKGTSFSPEGFGSAAYGAANIMVPRDQDFTEETILWEVNQRLPPFNEKLWLFDLHEEDRCLMNPILLEMCYAFRGDSNWAVVPPDHHDHAELSQLRCVEMFAGGFGGWSASWDLLQQLMPTKVHTLAIENQPEIAKAFAISRHAKFVPDTADLTKYNFMEGKWVIQQTIGSDALKLKHILASYQPHVMTISSPCPPWSGAGRAPGLEAPEGMLLPVALGYLRWSRPTIVLIEQVAGIRNHRHFSVIGHMLKLLGYRILWQQVVDLSQQAQPARARWLCLATRVHANIKVCCFQMWPADTTWGSSDVIATRIYDECDQLPTFLARYGSQHRFAESYLEEFGYFGFFLKDTGPAVGCRFFSPAEVGLAHGILDRTFLPTDVTEAWLLIGNQIAVPHALLLTCNACRFLGIDLEVREAFTRWHDTKLTASDAELKLMPGGYMLARHEDLFTATFHEVVAELLGHRHFLAGEFWDPDRGICTVDAPDIPPVPQASVVSQASDSEEDQQSDHMSPPLLSAHLQMDHTHQEFWFSPQLAAPDLEGIWDHTFQATFQLDAIPAMRLHRKTEPTFPGVIFLTCAFTLTTQEWHWDPRDDTLLVQVHAQEPTALTTVMHSLAEVLPATVLQKIHRDCCYTDQSGELCFRAQGTQGVIPAMHFRWIFAVSFAKMVLTALEKACMQTTRPPGTTVRIKLQLEGRYFWTGMFQADTTLETLGFVLRHCLAAVLGTRRLRFTQNGRQIAADTPLDACEFATHFQAVLLNVVPERVGGGNKNQLRIAQQTALASVLLDKGYALTWVTKTVERLVAKYSIQKLQAITGMAAGAARIRAIEELCMEASIDLPTPDLPQSRARQTGLPWAKAKKAKTTAASIDVSTYTLVGGFFANADGSDTQQIHDMRPQATGICLMTQSQAAAWIHSAGTISPDELAILVPGKMEVPSQLTSTALTFPCHNDKQEMVLLQGTLVQMGTKAIKYQQGPPTPLPSSGHLISLTIHKDEWPDSEWARAIEHTPAFLKEKLAIDGFQSELQALWGKSLRAQNSPASPLQATTIQMHGTIDTSKLPKLLQCSGFNKIYVVPKLPDGAISPAYRIIWLDVDRAATVCLSAQVPDCLGLVRGKAAANLGLRFAVDRHDHAWGVLHPGKPVPKLPGSQVLKLEGIPFGCTASTLQQWLTSIKWDAQPFKALGPVTWLLKADHNPPDGLHLYNSSPVLIRKLPPRNQQQERVLVGRPSKPIQKDKDPWQQSGDPWGGFRPTTQPPAASAAMAPRPTAGPVEARFQAQDDKIQALQTSLDELTRTSDMRNQEVHAKLTSMDQQHAQHQQQVHQAIQQVKGDLDTAMTANLKVHSSRMDAKFDELKELMIRANKRNKPCKAEDDMSHSE